MNSPVGTISLAKKVHGEGRAMTPQEAIRILMLSPIYFRLDLPARKELIQEFCDLCTEIILDMEELKAA